MFDWRSIGDAISAVGFCINLILEALATNCLAFDEKRDEMLKYSTPHIGFPGKSQLRASQSTNSKSSIVDLGANIKIEDKTRQQFKVDAPLESGGTHTLLVIASINPKLFDRVLGASHRSEG